eukprot:m.248854 g.248854  ORF g.248854 m.248854 type:complete len:398 (-) comp33866_c4_seq5:1152-2345(-)
MAVEDVVGFLCGVVFFIAWLAQIIALVEGVRWRTKRISNANTQTRMTHTPQVTVIKPVKGNDVTLVNNIETFFELDYPKFELVICIQDEHDKAIPSVKSLIAKYPHVNARLDVGETDCGENPKISNICRSYEEATSEFIWICDSGVPAQPGLLTESIQAALKVGDRLGILHQLPSLTLPTTFADYVEQIHFGTSHAKNYLFLNSFGFSCVNGMSSMFRKATMEDIGGLRQFGKYIGEDYYMSKSMVEHGYLTPVAPSPSKQRTPPKVLSDVYFRHMRWSRLRRKMMLASAISEPITECLPAGLMGAYALVSFSNTGMSYAGILMVHTALWIFADICLFHVVQETRFNFCQLPYWLAAWVTRSVGHILIASHAAISDEVNWRGHVYTLLPDGLAKKNE